MRELSALSGVAVSTIGNWENGYANPNIEAAVLVADALGISLDRYIGHRTKHRPVKQNRELKLMYKFLSAYDLLRDYEDFKKERESDG